MPSLLVDGALTPILHVSQLAFALGLAPPPGQEPLQRAFDLAATLDRWIEHLRPLDLTELTAPTSSRGRSLRNLTVNVFRPVALLPRAFETGDFPWRPEDDDERERELRSAEGVLAYAERALATYTGFLLEAEEALASGGPSVSSPRGTVSYADLLASQADHARFHLEQVAAHLGGARR